MDDVQSGGRQKEELLKFKEEAITIMEEDGFQLHKWHSNIPEVEAPLSASGNALASIVSPAYAKILGMSWNKTEDRLEIGFMKPLKEANDNKLTKRKCCPPFLVSLTCWGFQPQLSSQERSYIAKRAFGN